MAAMDEFREERAAIKNADFKTKVEYFLDYYKWHVIITAGVLFIVISLIYSVATKKEVAFSGYFINSTDDLFSSDTTSSTEISTEFAEIAGIDLNEYDVYIDSTLQYGDGTDEASMLTVQKLSTTLAAQDTDFIAANDGSFHNFYHMASFYDLRELYSEEELEKYDDYLYYIDMEVIRQENAALDVGDLNYKSEPYDHYAPENMVDPVPVAICIEESPMLEKLYQYYSGRIVLGISEGTQRVDLSLQFIDFLMEDVITE